MLQYQKVINQNNKKKTLKKQYQNINYTFFDLTLLGNRDFGIGS